MGDIGDYWRDHKDWAWRKKHGIRKSQHNLSLKPFICRCGKRCKTLDSLNQHIRVKGKEHWLDKEEYL